MHDLMDLSLWKKCTKRKKKVYLSHNFVYVFLIFMWAWTDFVVLNLSSSCSSCA